MGKRRSTTTGGSRMDVDSTGASTNTINCRKCKKPGHLFKDCKKKDVKCNFCQLTNHLGRDCFKNPIKANARGNAAGANGTNGTTANANTGNNGSSGNNGAQTNNNNQQQQQQNQRQQQGYVLETYTAYQGPQLWCPSCNSNTHAGDTCCYSKVHLSLSKMICLNCGVKGHTAADCRHPDPINCTICHRAGHKAAACKSEKAKWSALLGNKEGRFRWYETGAFTLNLTEAQQRQFHLDHEIERIEREELSGNNQEMIDIEALEQEYQNVAELSQIKWRGDQTEFLPIPLLHGKAVPTCTQSRSYRATRPQTVSGLLSSRFGNTGSNSSTASIMGDAGHAKVNDWLHNPRTTFSHRSISGSSNSNSSTATNASSFYGWLPPNHNMSPPEQREYFATRHRMYEEKLTSVQKAVREHTELSYSRYRRQNYNLSIRKLGLRIVEERALSEQRLTQVQMAMGQGWNFIRDPRAMEALARGYRCSCTTCGHEGVIHDGHLNPVDVEAAFYDAGYLLNLKDLEDWGLFVVFQCACSNKGYDWNSRSGVLLDIVEQPPTPPGSVGNTLTFMQ